MVMGEERDRFEKSLDVIRFLSLSTTDVSGQNPRVWGLFSTWQNDHPHSWFLPP